MSRKVSRKLVYVLSGNSSDTGHSLGVNALAMDPTPGPIFSDSITTTTSPQETHSKNADLDTNAQKHCGTMYSAGRDGLINLWNLYDMNLSSEHDKASLKHQPQVSKLSKSKEQQDSGEKSKTKTKPNYGHTKPAGRIQIHTNWVNDICLTSNYKHLVSCSADLTVKLWSPVNGLNDPGVLVGQHSDYVKCLSGPIDNDSWVISGGLDRKIKAWDLKENKGERFVIDTGDSGKNPKGSIYALTVNDGSLASPLIASGGPESTVALWDPRDFDSRGALRLVGHTDNIRSLLISQDAKWLLSGSSDSTVKLWSITAGRLMHSFDMHSDSVWSLYSNHPALDVFYSTDKSGQVIKTDLRSCSAKSDLDEGFSAIICSEHQGVSRILATDDYLWTCTSNSRIHRWQNVDTGALATAIGATNTATTPAEELFPDGERRAGTIGSLTSLSSLTAKLSDVKLGIHNSGGHSSTGGTSSPGLDHGHGTGTGGTNSGVATATNTAPSSPNLNPKSKKQGQGHSKLAGSSGGSGIAVTKKDVKTNLVNLFGGPAFHMLPLQNSRDINAQEELNVTVEPKFESPIETLEGRIGLLKHRLLTDRRRVLTLDTAGDMKLWDLLTGQVLESYERGLYDDIDDLADQLNTFNSVSNWCQVGIRTGELYVTLDSGTCFDAEVYADDLLENEQEDLVKLDPSNPTNFPIDHRFNFGKWVIVNLLRGLIDAEVEKISELEPLLESSESVVQSGVTATPQSDEVMHHIEVPVEPAAKAVPATTKADSSSSGGKFKGKFKGFGKKKSKEEKAKKEREEKEAADAAAAAAAAASNQATASQSQTQPAAKETANIAEYVDYTLKHKQAGKPFFKPPSKLDAPVVHFPAHVKVMISEQSPNSGGTIDLYRGTVGSIPEDIGQLGTAVPEWIGKLILNNEVPNKDPIKIGFVLQPLDPNIPGIVAENVKLTAFQMLRAYKIASYVEDRLKADNNGIDMEKYQIELYCQSQKLPGKVTLATIRTRFWRSGGDVVLKFKLIAKDDKPQAGAEAEKTA